MSAEYFPALPGLTWEIKPTPRFSTLVKTSTSGREARARLRLYPIWDYSLVYEFLSNDPRDSSTVIDDAIAVTQFETMLGFFIARSGSYDNFLLKPSTLTRNPDDDSVTGQPIGTGDGVTKNFQLLRSIGAGFDIVQHTTADPALYLNGVQAAAFTMGPNGLVQFALAPALGVAVTADFTFALILRFADDAIDFDMLQYLFYEAKDIKLTTVRLGPGDTL